MSQASLFPVNVIYTLPSSAAGLLRLRETPTGPAAALLTIVRQSPETAPKALHH